MDELPRVHNPLWDLTAWDKLTLAFDNVIFMAKFYAEVSLHIFTISRGIMFKNWKTTLAGVGGLITVVIQAIITGQITVEGITAAIASIGLIFAKDSNVTGGTTQQ